MIKMFKQAFKSYLATFRFKNIKKLRESSTYGYMCIVFLVMYGIIALLQDNGLGDAYCLMFLRAIVPVGLMGWSNMGSKYLMPKAMFLCPMKEEERKEYINCVLIIKIGAMAIASLCVELIWSMFLGFDWWKLIIVPFVFASFGVANYMGCGIKLNNVGQIPDVIIDKYGNRIAVWMNAVSVIVSFMLLVGITVYDMDKKMFEHENESNILGVVAITICSMVIVLFDFLIIKKQYKPVIDQTSDYELNFKIKVVNQKK